MKKLMLIILLIGLGCGKSPNSSVQEFAPQRGSDHIHTAEFQEAIRYLDPVFSATTEINDIVYLVVQNVFTLAFDTLKMNVVFPDPDTATSRWAVVFAPGGAGNRNGHLPFRQDMAKRGYVVLSYDRRQNPTILPGAPNPQSWQIYKGADAGSAISWIRSRADLYGLDKERVISSGSAGGATSGAMAAYANLDSAGLTLFNSECPRPNLVTGVSFALNANTLGSPFPGYPFNYNSEIEVGEPAFSVFTASESFRVANTKTTFFHADSTVEAQVKVKFGSMDHGIPNLGEINSAIEISKLAYDYFNGLW